MTDPNPSSPPRRRLGAAGAKNRERLIEAASQLLVEEGYVAVTARRISERAGLKPELVFYYFNTMDDVIVGIVQRNSSARMARLNDALTSGDPLRALWELNSERQTAITTSELLALANHRPSIRAVIVAVAREFRRFQINAVAQVLEERGFADAGQLAGAIVTIGAALGRALAQDGELGVDEGYAEALVMLEHGLELARFPPTAS